MARWKGRSGEGTFVRDGSVAERTPDFRTVLAFRTRGAEFSDGIFFRESCVSSVSFLCICQLSVVNFSL